MKRNFIKYLNSYKYTFQYHYYYYSHGTTKVLTGAGVWALGAVTGNQQLQSTGKALKTLGAATLVGSHFLPTGGR